MYTNNIMYKAGFIGCGNMGGTLAAVAAKSVGGANILTADHFASKLEALEQSCGCVPGTATQVAEQCRVIFLGVKPQVLDNAAAEIRPILNRRTDHFVVVSMAAGQSLMTVSSLLGDAPVIRIMPNTPAGVGEGVILYTPGVGVTSEDEELFLELMKHAGVCAKLEEEKIDMGCALTGCGPAFVCLLMEAMTDAGVRCGLPYELSKTFALQTFAGTAKLALETGREPAALRAAVCSPAGSTIEGVVALERCGARNAMMEAVEAAYRRTVELGKGK
jgi:pyrroline-5-carboxylate reductase